MERDPTRLLHGDYLSMEQKPLKESANQKFLIDRDTENGKKHLCKRPWRLELLVEVKRQVRCQGSQLICLFSLPFKVSGFIQMQ